MLPRKRLTNMTELQSFINACDRQNILYTVIDNTSYIKILLDEDLIGPLRTPDDKNGSIFNFNGKFIKYGH